MESYMAAPSPRPSQRDTLIVIPRVIEPNKGNREYNNLDSNNSKGLDLGSILDNINGIISTIIGLINIGTFLLQLRDRKNKKKNIDNPQ